MKRASIKVEVFDTTADQRHARLRESGVNVAPLSWPHSFAVARNDALASLLTRDVADAVLWLDTDEWLPEMSMDCASTLQALPLGSDVAFCPIITDGVRAAEKVGRLHRLAADVRFDGAVHEYLVGPEGALDYRGLALTVRHAGYSNWDRSARNDQLLRRQIDAEPHGPRWRPFWVRDAGATLETVEIARAIREQARLPRLSRPLGGLSSEDYTRMIAWHGAFHLMQKAAPELLWAALSRLKSEDLELRSELIYLRTVAGAKARILDPKFLEQMFEFRAVLLQGNGEYPWLDAAVCIGLELQGRFGEAEAYRAECVPYTDSFCEDSRLRRSVVALTGG